MAVKYMMCSLPILRSSKKQIAVVLVLGVVPQFTRQGKANRMAFMVSSMNQNSRWIRVIRVNVTAWKVGFIPREMGLSSSYPISS